MNHVPSLPTFSEVNTALKKFNFHASQAHGIICGLICALSKKEINWGSLLHVDRKNKKAHELLKLISDVSFKQMSEFSFEFSLLLPNDKVDINVRTESLGLWCQGFLTGLQHGNVPITGREPGEVTEALEDLVEIAQVNYGEITPGDEDEGAYFELVEYVRLAILLIFQDLSETKFLKKNDTLLH